MTLDEECSDKDGIEYYLCVVLQNSMLDLEVVK